MKIEVRNLILNEFDEVKKIVESNMIPSYYDNVYVLINRLYRYFMEIDSNNAIELLKQKLDALEVLYDEQLLNDTIGSWEVVTPLKRTDGIKIYKSEIDKINKINGRSNQRVAFGLLMIQKILNNNVKEDTKLWLEDWNDIFSYVKMSNSDVRNKALYELHQQKVIKVPLFENYIELNIIEFNGKVVKVVTEDFDKVDTLFDELFVVNTNLETIIAYNVVTNETEVHEHTGFRGCAREISQKHGVKITGSKVKECCELKRLKSGSFCFYILPSWCECEEKDCIVYDMQKDEFVESNLKVETTKMFANMILGTLNEDFRKYKKEGLYVKFPDKEEVVRIF